MAKFKVGDVIKHRYANNLICQVEEINNYSLEYSLLILQDDESIDLISKKYAIEIKVCDKYFYFIDRSPMGTSLNKDIIKSCTCSSYQLLHMETGCTCGYAKAMNNKFGLI